MRLDNFKGKSGSGKTLAVTVASQTLLTSGGQALKVTNLSANALYFHYTTDNSVAAATTVDGGWSFSVGPNAIEIHDLPAGITNVTYIAAVAGPSAALVCEGEGS